MYKIIKKATPESLRIGKNNELLFVELALWLNDILPIVSVKLAPWILDRVGIDVIIHLEFNEKKYVVPFQVKSSEIGKDKFLSTHPHYGGKVKCVVVNGARSNLEICHEIIHFVHYILVNDIQLQNFLLTVKGRRKRIARKYKAEETYRFQKRLIVQKLIDTEHENEIASVRYGRMSM